MIDGLLPTNLSSDSQPAHIEASENSGSLEIPTSSQDSSAGVTPATGLHTAVDRAVTDLYEGDASEYTADGKDGRLIRSFDMIFKLHQRSEEIREHLENIDRLLLRSRTLTGLVEKLPAALEHEFDLTAARILFRHDHSAAEIFKVAAPRGIGIIPPRFTEHESLFTSDTFVLDDPNGDLSRSLFGDATPLLSSAIAATLCADGDDMGLLCLGSEDPNRYCGGMNTDLIASLADKIAFGLRNAWDHECRERDSIAGCTAGIYSESFFREYLAKEFARSWRTRNAFSLMAFSWISPRKVEPIAQVAEHILDHVRASDVVAESDSGGLWLLLPGTDIDGAKVVAERLSSCLSERFDEEVGLHCGITSFSKYATALPMLINQAQDALKEAEEAGNNCIVTKI